MNSHKFLRYGIIGVLILSISFIIAQNVPVVTEITSETITQAPFNCSTTAFSCDLSYKGVTRVAPDAFINHSNLHYLDLNDNQITSLESGAFNGLEMLNSLNLTNNQISFIEPGTFNGLSKLDSLFLTNNKLVSLSAGIFTSLTSLTNLYLPNNLITTIGSDTFRGLSALKSLHLSDNLLTVITPTMFQGTPLLTNLYLGTNFITTIAPNSFLELSNLQVLYLANNLISSLEGSDFQGLSSLDGLYLSNNQIHSIEPDDFANLSSLKSLYLTNNQIYLLQSGSFSKLPNLKVLYLTKNLLTSLQKSYFNGLSSLVELRLDGNNITSIPSDTFDYSVLPALSLLSTSSLCNPRNQTGYYSMSNILWTSDSYNCVVGDSFSLDRFLSNLSYRDYSLVGNNYFGDKAFNFLDESRSTFLTNITMFSAGYIQSFYKGRAEIEYSSGVRVLFSGGNFTGVFFAPILLHPTSIFNLSGVSAAVKFGDISKTVTFQNGLVRVKLPVIGKLSGDKVWIYSSPSFGNTRTFYTGTVVYIDSEAPYVSFLTNHGGDYAVSDTPYAASTSSVGTKVVIVPITPGHDLESQKESKRAVEFITDEDVCPSSRDGHCGRIKESLASEAAN